MQNKIVVSGITGFVGNYLKKYFEQKNVHIDSISLREPVFEIPTWSNVVIHLAGLAHDTKNTQNDDAYFKINFELTKKLFDQFLLSDASTFIFISSIKAVADNAFEEITELTKAHPASAYGRSKLAAEKYLIKHFEHPSKKVYILRPTLIYGPGVKGNLRLLQQMIKMNIPWFFGRFWNERSFCSVENLSYVIHQLSTRSDVASGVFNVADDTALSSTDLYFLIARSQGKRPIRLDLPKVFVKTIALIGSSLHLPFNSETLGKLTDTFKVSNGKIKDVLGIHLPVDAPKGISDIFKVE